MLISFFKYFITNKIFILGVEVYVLESQIIHARVM